jgi:hypothetical protein
MVAWHEVPGTRSEMGPSRMDGLRAVFVTVFTREASFRLFGRSQIWGGISTLEHSITPSLRDGSF